MTDSNPLILTFADIRAADLPLVGGKGANLGELTHAGFTVPPGFCLTTAAFQQFMSGCPEADELYAQLERVASGDLVAARAVGEQVRQTLLQVPIPERVATAVRQQWQQSGRDHAYAVRSSATAEDLPDASFAGQQDSYLNIRGETALLDAVRRCWVSLFTDRAILYRRQNQFSHREVQLSVVVQQMVMSELSGTLFTADPLTGHRHTTVIDASFGLGEALVSGIVSPDSYRVDKRDLRIIDRQIADKQLAVMPVPVGGTRQEAIAPDQRRRTALSDGQIVALTAVASRVEAHFGGPQDIEWGIVADQIYLLQSRPITSLYPIDSLQSPDGSLHIYFSMGHQQMMTNAISPLGISTIRCVAPMPRVENGIEGRYIHASGGHIFLDATLPLRHPILRHIFFNGSAQFDALAPAAARAAMKRPEFQRPYRLPLSLAARRGGLRQFSRLMATLWRHDLTGAADRAEAIIQQHLDQAAAELNGAPLGAARIELMIGILHQLYLILFQWAHQFLAGEIAARMLGRLGGRWADPADLAACLLGLPGNVVNEMNLALGDLADLARPSPELCARLQQLESGGGRRFDTDSWTAGAAALAGSAPFLQAWGQFLEKYGARGSSEIDIRTPRWYEEPLPLLQVVAGYLQKEADSHRAQQKQLAQARQTAVSRLTTAAGRGLWGWPRAKIVRRLLHVAQQGTVLREHHKFMMVRLLRIFKEQLQETAVWLIDRKAISAPDDIWFLSWPELLALCRGDGADIAARIPQRQADQLRYQKMSPPLIITSDGETPVVRYEVADAPPGALIGNPVSAGIREGTVRVILDPHTEMLLPGEILVAPFTDPGWTPLFINAGGLIMEVGGIMTHGSVVAREYGIPAVVGVRNATTSLQTGQRVRLDGNRGVIELI